MKNILIIEDTPSDIKYYQPLFSSEREVSLLILNDDKDFTEEKLRELIKLLYDDIYSNIKNYYICTKENILKFLKDNDFDFYIIDSLDGFAELLVTKTDLNQEKVAFLSSTKSFRESIQNKGSRVYRKENINDLIKDCL